MTILVIARNAKVSVRRVTWIAIFIAMAVLTVYSLDIVIQVGFTLEVLDSHLSSHHLKFFSGHSRLSSNNASKGPA